MRPKTATPGDTLAVLTSLFVLAGALWLGRASLLPAVPAQGAAAEPAARITDLLAASPRPESVRLLWTAPASSGGARHEVLRSPRPIGEGSWNDPQAVRTEMSPPPAEAGSRAELLVKDLSPGKTYYFAIREAGPGGERSPISNVAKATTLPAMSGRDIYVSPEGDDAADGSAAKPYRTLLKACGLAQAGDTVRARAGLYLSDRCPLKSGVALVSEDGPGKAVVDGQGKIQHLVTIWGKERLVSHGRLILQLHRWDVEHHHGRLGDPDIRPYGNGVLLWFELDDFDAAVARAEEMKAEVIKPRHRSENAHWECWLRDPEGYTIVLASPHGSAG